MFLQIRTGSTLAACKCVFFGRVFDLRGHASSISVSGWVTMFIFAIAVGQPRAEDRCNVFVDLIIEIPQSGT